MSDTPITDRHCVVLRDTINAALKLLEDAVDDDSVPMESALPLLDYTTRIDKTPFELVRLAAKCLAEGLHRISSLDADIEADFASDLERALNECEAALKTDYYDTLSAKRRSDALATVAKLREKYK